MKSMPSVRTRQGARSSIQCEHVMYLRKGTRGFLLKIIASLALICLEPFG
jgi:hypothetical protein